MTLRLLEVVIPADLIESVREALQGQPAHGVWEEPISDRLALVRVLLSGEHTEEVCDRLEGRFASHEGFRVLLLPVEATIPRLPEAQPAEEAPAAADQPPAAKRPRISREELYADIGETVRPSMVYLVMVILSAVVAAIGLLRDNVAILIGAMVIAPLLGPNVALALATTLGDVALARRAVAVTALGVLTTLALAVLLGAALAVDPTIPELAARTQVGLGDIALALASGVAGALAFTTGASSALIGVMVAVALLPPLVTLGLLLGSGNWRLAEGAALLFLINITCINLAGVVTFLAQGVRPRAWWEASRATRASRITVGAWIVLLLLLAVLIILAERRGA